jgi:hypothetical protein
VRLRPPSGHALLPRLRLTALGPGVSPLDYAVDDGALRVSAHGLRGIWASGLTSFRFHLEGRALDAADLPRALPVEIELDLRAPRFATTKWTGTARLELPLAALAAPGEGDDTTTSPPSTPEGEDTTTSPPRSGAGRRSPSPTVARGMSRASRR